MKRRIQVYDNGTAYLGRQAAEQGYKGELDAFFNAFTITIVKPNTSLETMKRSLEIVLQDIELRISQEKPDEGQRNAKKDSV